MNSLFYMKLAYQNIRKNRQTYVPYILTCTGSVMMFDILYTLALSREIGAMHGGSDMRTILSLGCVVAGLFTGLFLFYTNSFLMKRRKMEIGLYNILGMGKPHIGRILFFETVFMAITSLAGGIAGGFLLSKAVYLLLLRLVQTPVQWGFYFSPSAAWVSVLLYGSVFLLILAVNLGRVHLSSPARLLRGGRTGEREPRARLGITVAGAGALGAGYYIALTTQNPAQAIGAFFIAALLVIIGTYCLFMAGSIALLKCLKKRKGFYYKTSHFIAVSGLLYRMRQNAAGLAGICILSTSVLVMLSSTAALYVGLDDVIRNRFPRNIVFQAGGVDEDGKNRIIQTAGEVLGEAGVSPLNPLSYSDLSFLVTEEDGLFQIQDTYTAENMESICPMYVMTAKDYAGLTGSGKAPGPGECMVVTRYHPYESPQLNIMGRTYQVLPSGDLGLWQGADYFGKEVYYLILHDERELRLLESELQEQLGEQAPTVAYHYQFDLDAADETQIEIFRKLTLRMAERSIPVAGESAAEQRGSFYSLYAGLLFLGIFLGTLFVMATVLIIYYKQVTEGHDDKERFEIMQKVGLEQGEIRACVRSQLLLMFFLPLAVAALHILAAFPLITKLLSAMNLTNVGLFASATVATLGAFGLVYGAVYVLTSRVYLKIVS